MKTILLVEDEALIAMTEAKMLRNHGYDVLIAYNAENAVERVRETDIDLILMDIDLGAGKMDGTEAAEIILDEHDIPIAFLSSHTEPEIVEKTEGITSYGYIVKNSGETVLLASIKMAFRLYDAHMELKRQKENLNTALINYERTAEELAEKSEEVEKYFTSSLDMLCIADTEGVFVRLNPEWEKTLGYPVTDLEGRSFLDFVHEEDREATLHAVAKLEAQEEVKSFENRLRCKDGSYRWIEWRSTPIGTRIYAAARDITERKQAECEIKKREDNLRITLNSIGDAVIATDKQGNITRMNPVAERLTGWSVDAAKGETLNEVFHIIHAITREIVDNPVGRVLQSGEIVGLANHTVLISKNGREYQIADSASPIKDAEGNINGVVLVFRDVTEKYEKERQITENEKKYRGLFTSIRDAILVADTDRNIIDCNPAFSDLFGYRLQDIRGKKTVTVYQSEEEYAQMGKALREHKGDLSNFLFTVHYKRKDGTAFPGETNVFYFRDDTDEVTGFIGLIRDITERKKAEKELHESEEKYYALFNQAVDAIYLHDYEGNIIDVNKVVCEQTGYSKSELLQLSIFDIHVTGRDTINMSKTETKRIWRESKVGERYSFELEHKRKDGTIFPVRLSTGAIHYGNRNVIMAIVEDITERKQREEKLQKALEEKDFLMKEINHRVKNNLAMVSSLIKLKNSALGDEIDLSDLNKRINAIRLIHDKLYHVEKVTHIGLKEYIQELSENVFSLSKRHVEIEEHIDNISLSTKTAIPLGLIINELATNAMKYGFTVEADARFCIDLTEDKNRNQYILSISNTGKPFPTEIGLDNPTTLGLQLVSTLVDQLEGTIELQREPNTKYIIQFPAGK